MIVVTKRGVGYVDYGSPEFLGLLMSAQDGCVVSRNLVVVASAPCVWKLTPDADEAQDLFAWIIEYTLPRWNGAHDWALHCGVTLRSRLLTLRRGRDRMRKRGLGWL